MRRNGVSLQKTISSPLLNSALLALVEAILLVGLGALAVIMHNRFRLPMNLPGRHGFEWIALLVLGRVMSRRKVAASLTGLGAAAFSLIPSLGFSDPFMPVIYLVPSFIMDAAFYFWPRLGVMLLPVAFLGGLAHTTKPLIRWVVALATGHPYHSLLTGLLYPLSTHLLFGLMGGLMAALIVWGIRKIEKKRV